MILVGEVGADGQQHADGHGPVPVVGEEACLVVGPGYCPYAERVKAVQTLAGLSVVIVFSVAVLAAGFVTRYGLQQNDSVSVAIGTACGLVALALVWFLKRTPNEG